MEVVKNTYDIIRLDIVFCDAPAKDSLGDCDVVIGGRGDIKSANKVIVAEPWTRDGGGDDQVEDAVLEPKAGIEGLVKWRGNVEDVPSILGEDVDIAVGDETGYGGGEKLGTCQDGGGIVCGRGRRTS